MEVRKKAKSVAVTHIDYTQSVPADFAPEPIVNDEPSDAAAQPPEETKDPGEMGGLRRLSIKPLQTKKKEVQEVNPSTLTANFEEVFSLGYIPLDNLSNSIKNAVALAKQKKVELTSIDFGKQGYITDAVIKTMVQTLGKSGLANVIKISLEGCSIITDVGLHWLVEGLTDSNKKNIMVNINGCTKVSDGGLAALANCPNVGSIEAMATMVTHLSGAANTKGCPLLVNQTEKTKTTKKEGHVIVVPIASSHSLSACLKSGKAQARQPFHHSTDVSMQDWKINITEVERSHVLFSPGTTPNPVHAIITFDAGSDLQQLKQSIGESVAHVISKELVNPKISLKGKKISVGSRGFMDSFLWNKCNLSADGILRNTSDTPSVIGAVVSMQPLSRSNPYFEVQCLVSKAETGIIIGIMHDILLTDRFPLDSKERSGGAVDGLEMEDGAVYGFGVKGSWQSEYVPGEDATYYFTKNGEELEDKKTSEKPHIGMYPIVSVMGKNFATVKFLNMACPPEPLLKKWEDNEQWWTPLFGYNVLYDDSGIVSYDFAYDSSGTIGLLTFQQAITRAQNTFSIEILKQSNGSIITMGLGSEDYPLNRQPGWEKGSVAYHGDNGKFYLEQGTGTFSGSGSPTVWKTGDVITAVVKDFGDNETIQPGDTVVVDFYLNEKLVQTVKHKLTGGKAGTRWVFMLGLKGSDTQVLIKNFRPAFFPPPPRMDMLTMGRANFMNVHDDGRLVHRRFDKRELFSTFISKTPFNKQLTYFEMRVKHLSGDMHAAIGIAPANYLVNKMVGWLGGSLGYHADNGYIYDSEPHGKKSTVDNAEYATGDVVGCGFETQGVTYKEDGSLKPQQKLRFFFTKNGKRVHVVEFTLRTANVFPAVNLHFEPDELVLENFYPGAESGEMGVTVGEAKHQIAEEKEEGNFVEGCQVTLVAMGTEQETAGKVQLLRNMMDGGELQFPMLSKIEEHLALMESDPSLMNLQGQQLYGQLNWQKECLDRFKANIKSRVKVMAVDITSGKGKDELVDRIVQVCEADLASHPHLYNLQDSIATGLEKITTQVKAEKMLASRDLDIKEFTRNTRVYEQAVRYLQTKGQLIWVPMKRTVIALDIEFAKTLVKMSSSLPSNLSGKMAPCIGAETRVWNSIAEIFPDVQKLGDRKWDLLNHVMLVMGVIEVPRVRVRPEDPQYCYCTPSGLGSLPVNLADFQSKDKDVMLVSREYTFLYSCATYILSMVISRCLLVSRPVALSKEWAVFQSGAAQTLLYIHDGCGLRVETRCFMPAKQSDRLDFDTQFHVEEYSFNVFCIFIDMIDLIITRLRLKVTYTQNVPRNLVNTSIGCIHDWGLSDEEFRQTLCTLCNQCCNKGRNCPYNGVGGVYKHQCGCNTLVTGCRDCGICQGCAELLWTIRSYLRPNLEVASFGQMQSNGMVPLDATTYDELEFTNLGMHQVPVCLAANTFASESKGVITKMFPAMATEFPNLQSLQEHMDKLQPAKNEEERLLRFGQGDTVTVKLDPIKRDSKTVVVVEDETPLEITPVYFTAICRECTVWHDTGIVAYNTMSTAVPVGQFISALPLTKECPSFSFEITNKGEHGYVAIGVCPKRYPPDRQPGWNSGSVGYHADDGGIFVAAGWPATRKEKCTTGDIMECRLNFDDQTISFLKNGNEIYKSRRQRTFTTLHAAVGFHSVGEAVRLLQKEPWKMAEDQEPVLPSAFDAYKYGNMHISPGRTLTLKKVGRVLRSWLMIHNPSKSKVGYKIIPTDIVSDPLGFLEPSGAKAFGLSLSPGTVGVSVEVHWFLLESTRDYTDEDVKDVYNHTTSESLLKHRLKVKVTDVQSTDSRPLKVSTEEPDPTDCYLAEVFKNGVLVASYWLKGGSYVCSLPQKCDILVRYPKFPTLDQPNGFQKGMRVIVDLTKTQKELYAEAVIEEATVDGYLRLEYSQPGENTNACMEAKITSPEISIKEIEYEETVRAVPAKGEKKDGKDETDNAAQGDKAPDTDKKIEKVAVLNLLSFQSRGHISVTKRAYMYPPFHLLTEASRAAINSIDESWRANTLSSVAQCKNVPTRLTVQEFQICGTVGSNLDWLMGSGRGSKASRDLAFAFMPSDLGIKQLCYPNVSDMFTSVDVHTLCFYMLDMGQQLRPLTDDDELSLDVPLHFMDLAPVRPTGPGLTPEMMYACSFNGWIYSTLYSNKLCLPSYENIFSGGDVQQMNRPEVEYMMSNLIHMYAAQCHIFAEQYGGLMFQITPDDRTITVLNATELGVEDIGAQSYCGAHKWCLGLDARLKNQSAFRKEVFSPYEETIHVFNQEFPMIPSLPSDFFQFFNNLQFVSLQGCHKLKQIPDGMSGCDRLKMLSLKNSGLESLPADLFLAPRLCRLHCSGLPVKSLPTALTEHCQLTELVLSWMLLSSVPKELGQLTQVKYLDLSGNPLVTLPMEMKGLTKLKTLLLSGIPWLVTEGHVNGVSVEEYEHFLNINPSLTHIVGKEKLVSMFHECDHNKNQRLDGAEATTLNLHIFWQVPRLGSSCISDSEYGGIPPVVFLLSSLETLHLNYQALTVVPVHMCRLQNLRELSVSNNPLLESVPGALGHLPNLKSLRLTSNPSLRTPPHEVVSRGFASIKAYLKRLAGGFTECRRTKLMLVGLGGAGKTSLLRALMSSDKKTAGTKGEDITNGIDILPWTIKSQDGIEVTYNTWDFAGQTLYYNTHQFFLSKRAVYLLLWSTRQGFEHAGLEFWLSSIASHAPKTPIFVVGTHCDQVPKADIPSADLQERFKQIAGFHFVSSTEGKGIKELEQDLLRVTLEQKNMGEKVPKVWLNMEKKILAARQHNSILPWKTIQEFGMEVGIYDEKDIREAVQFLHELGTVQYFDNEFLRKQVVINPQWIVDVMSCVVSVKNSPIQDHKGRFLHKYIPEIWASYPKELHEWLLRLTEEFDLTFPLPEDKVNIVPCLLPQEMPAELNWPTPDLSKNMKETKLIYKFTYLPTGLFNRAQVRLFQLSDGRLIWKRGSLLKKNKHKALISQTSDFELQVKVQGPRPENVIFLIHEIFESLIKESFHGVVYEFLVPCPDCILKEGTLDPSMFEGSLVMRARELKAPFLQCRKYFHTISMAQFYEVMPSDGTSDFDAHLQKSLIAMQQLTSDLSTDVAIIYSSLDMADDADSHRLNPEQVKRDLEAGGITCWFSNDMDGTPIDDIMLALKNCKVVVALVSDNFESDTNSNDLLLYTLDTLNKDFAIVVIGDSMEWQNTDLGMRIGKHEEMVMVRNKSRYNQERVSGMLTVVNNKLLHNQPQVQSPPSVFISYCWSNSKIAHSLGTKCSPEALGWGDPREIKQELESRGLSCWLDSDQPSAGKGLYKNIVEGIRNSKVLVACVSDEYAESANCMMELRFGILQMNLPTIVVVVGTGNKWKQSEVGLHMQRSRAAKVYFQKENPESYDILEAYVRERLPEHADQLVQKEAAKAAFKSIQQKEKSKEKKKHTDNSAIQEEYELMQRKFMRHIISFVSTMDQQPTPRLLVVDFEGVVQEKVTAAAVSSLRSSHAASEAVDSPLSKSSKLRPTLRPKTASRSMKIMNVVLEDKDTTWDSEQFCLKVLCEHEKGWHLCKTSFPVRMNEEMKNTIKGCSIYLARMYAILRQSSVGLNCFEGSVGQKFVSWVEQNAMDNANFLDSYMALRAKLVDDDDAQPFLSQLQRYHLPTGKIFWLCEEHARGPRTTRLLTEGTTSSEVGLVLFDEDVKLREALVHSPAYSQRKGARCPAAGITLPPMETTQGPNADSEENEALLQALLPKLEPAPVATTNSTRRRPSEAVTGSAVNSTAKPPLPQSASSKALNAGAASPRSSGPPSAKATAGAGELSRKQSSVSMKAAASTVAGVRKAAAASNSNSSNANGKGSKTCVVQ